MSADRVVRDDDAPPFVMDSDLTRGLHRLGGYTSHMGVSVERQYENLLDWEHLPYLHPASFPSCELLRRGRWWWLCRIGRPGGGDAEICLQIDPAGHQWAIRVEAGRDRGQLIHITHTEPGPRELDLELSFWSPIPPRNDYAREAMYTYYREQFGRLYDEDGAAMLHRQETLDQLASRVSDVEQGQDLGSVDEVRARAPFQLRWNGTRYWIIWRRGALAVYSADCPHMLGPVSLPGRPLADGTPCDEDTVSCPWHGYRFDLGSGRTVGEGRKVRLRPPFTLELLEGRVRVRLP